MTKVDPSTVRVKIYIMAVDPYHPSTVGVKIFIMAVDPYSGIQMNRKELTETFMMISN